MEIRALREADDRTRFRSGDPDLDRFLLKYAGQNQFRHHIGTTYVAVDRECMLGYVTIAPGHLEVAELPARARRSLPRYPVPILRIARLATDLEVRGAGVARQLLRFTFQLALRLATEYGCLGVVVDAKPGAVEFYRRFGFLGLDAVQGQADAKPTPVAMFLSIREIEAASGGPG